MAYGSDMARRLSIKAQDLALLNAENYVFYALEMVRAHQNALRAAVKESEEDRLTRDSWSKDEL